MAPDAQDLILDAIRQLGATLGRELGEVKDRVGKLEAHVAKQNGRLYSVETQQKIDAAVALRDQQSASTVEQRRAWAVPAAVSAATALVVLVVQHFLG